MEVAPPDVSVSLTFCGRMKPGAVYFTITFEDSDDAM